MTTLSKRLGLATNRLYPRLVHDAGAALADSVPAGSLDQLAGRKYCTVVTFRQNGTPIATPVWFGIGNGRLYFRSLAAGAKLRRLARNDRVLVAPCSGRGRPLGPPFRGRARVLDGSEAAAAERWIQSNYSLGRRVYEWLIADAEARYVEVTPSVGDDSTIARAPRERGAVS